MPPVRLGLIGAGRWGKICLRTIQALSPHACLAAVASGNPATAALVDCPVHPSWRDLLEAGQCDAVVITTPPATHAEISIAALEAGLPVFIEKPLTLRPDQARAVRATALRCGLPALVDHIHLFSPAFRTLLAMAPHLGSVLAIEAMAGKPGAMRDDASVLWDWGAHDVAMCLTLMGSLPEIQSAKIVSRLLYADGIGDVIELALNFGGVPARLQMGCMSGRQRIFTVHCQGGTLVYDDLADHKLRLDDTVIEVAVVPPLTVALTEFCHQVSGGVLDVRGLDVAVSTVDILSQAGERLS